MVEMAYFTVICSPTTIITVKTPTNNNPTHHIFHTQHIPHEQPSPHPQVVVHNHTHKTDLDVMPSHYLLIFWLSSTNTVSVSDGKIQMIILILRRGALSRQFRLYIYDNNIVFFGTTCYSTTWNHLTTPDTTWLRSSSNISIWYVQCGVLTSSKSDLHDQLNILWKVMKLTHIDGLSENQNGNRVKHHPWCKMIIIVMMMMLMLMPGQNGSWAYFAGQERWQSPPPSPSRPFLKIKARSKFLTIRR